ncbi:hypothetical protein C4552_02790 [Candidatus Parcubacteria bacterium]|nr:MAG: hypothetical protein C4552_02790 [Candidatus Parcubacteria bacterium]
MNVHIVLKKNVAANPATKQEVLNRLAALGMTAINQQRLERYGIVSGDLPEEQLDALQNVGGIEAFRRDGTKHASNPSRRPDLGPNPTEGDEFFQRLSEGAKRAYE